MDYFSVDLETSGPVPGRHNLLSIGLTHIRRLQGTYQTRATQYVELQPIFPEFDEAAMRIHGLDPDRLRREGRPPMEAMADLVRWVESQRQSSEVPVFVAHNAPFDWMFWAYHVGHARLENPFGFSALDTKALAMGALGLSWSETTLKTVARMVRASHPDPSQLHHAGEDARHTARVFCALMNGREAGTL